MRELSISVGFFACYAARMKPRQNVQASENHSYEVSGVDYFCQVLQILSSYSFSTMQGQSQQIRFQGGKQQGCHIDTIHQCLPSWPQLLLILMLKYMKILGRGLKIALYLGTGTVTTSFCYLQYINSQIGGIDIDRQAMVRYYTDKANQFSITPSQASNMYYWLILDISIMRVLTYHSYRSYCEKVNKRIVDQSLKNYQDRSMLKKIEDVSKEGKPSKAKQVFEEILSIRRQNFQNIEKYDYIVKELRKQQKLMDTRSILGLSKEKLEKLEKIHKFICEKGEQFKNTEVMRYNDQVPSLEEMFPGDKVHKILFI